MFRIDDDGCHNDVQSQTLTCIRDPDSAIASYENLHDVARRACFYVSAEWDSLNCRDTPEVCEQKFQLGWVKSKGSQCNMKVFAGFNAIHSVVASPGGFLKVGYPAECENICLSKPECDFAIWHEASVNEVWGNVCVTMAREQMIDFGRLDRRSWVEQKEVVTMVKLCD